MGFCSQLHKCVGIFSSKVKISRKFTFSKCDMMSLTLLAFHASRLQSDGNIVMQPTHTWLQIFAIREDRALK